MSVLRQEPSSPPWDAIRIKGELQRRGLSLAEVSRQHGYHPNSAARALRVAWPEMERIIAAVLDEKPETLWPDRYIAGVPRKYLPRRKLNGG